MLTIVLAIALAITPAIVEPQRAYAETLTVGAAEKPAQPTIVILKSRAAGQATIKVRKVSGATGYRFKVARNVKMTKGKKYKTVKRRWTTFKTLTKGKVYYVRVRAYTLVGGKRVWSAWSAVKKIRVKNTTLYDLAATDSSISTTQLSMTLAQMAEWQMPYTNGNSLATVNKLLNPENVKPGSSAVYQFANLKGYSGLSASQLNNYIASTESGRAGKLRGKGSAFVAAAKKYNVNECYLLAHAILESGWGTSELASGFKYEGKTYYNFYGIGAYDGNALSGGRGAAVKYGWDSPKAAIMGAAEFVSTYYFNREDYPQYTLYGMKWDYVYSNSFQARGWHQYATDPYWPTSISTLMNECYVYNQCSPSLKYVVPKYR